MEQWTTKSSLSNIDEENQAITKALQMSLSSNISNDASSSSPTSYSSSASQSLMATSAPGRSALGAHPAGKITKRKPREKKQQRLHQTMYINTDPSNFRAMVQQMTGPPGPVIIKPEPMKQSFQAGFVQFGFDDHGFGSVQPPPAAAESDDLGFDVESFLSFPILESWGTSL